MKYKDVEIGQLIKAYHKGFHIVTGKEIENGYELVKYKQVLTSKYTKPKYSPEWCCNVGFCDLVTKEFIEKMKEDFAKNMETLENVYRNNI